MIRLSKLTDYAFVVLAFLSKKEGQLTTANEIAVATSLPEPTVGKILKQLAKSDFVKSSRGSAGGYVLGKEAKEITVADVIQIMEGPIAIISCVGKKNNICAYEEKCPTRGKWDKVNLSLQQTLKSFSLEDLSRH